MKTYELNGKVYGLKRLAVWGGIGFFIGLFWWLVGLILTSPVMVSRFAEAWAGVW